MSLSDKRQTNIDPEFSSIIYLEEDVKEFIRQLREELCCGYEDWGGHKCYNCKQIDKLTGKRKI